MNRSERPRPDPAGAPKILLIRLRRIGDIVMTTPSVAALRRALPRASVDYVVEEPFRRLVEGNPNIDRVLAIPAKQGLGDFARFVRGLRRERYDCIIDFHGGPRASRIAWLAKGRLKIGYDLKYKGWIYDVRVPRTGGDGPIHSVENHLNLVRALGITVDSPAPLLSLPEATAAEKARIDGLWAEHELGGARVVVLHVGAGNAFRDWGEPNLTALAAGLADLGAAKGGAAAGRSVRVLLAGAEGDRLRAERIAAACQERDPSAARADTMAAPVHPNDDPVCTARARAFGGRSAVVSLAGTLNLIELKELIARAALYIGPDSGPMHIAAATTTPIVALFGPTLPAYFAPWRAEAAIVEKRLDCRPCRQRECLTADYRCMQDITVDDVLAAARRFL